MSIQKAGEGVATVEVKIGPQFLNLFSEHLYSSPNKAFEELVSNSWDAGARRVFIHIPDELEQPDASIWVLDDGAAMDVAGFTALWSVATSSKRQTDGTNERKPIGKFGVGKLATYLLAHELTYVCRAPDGVIRAVTMDYRRIDDHEKGALHINPLPLSVREITSEELPTLLDNVPGRERILELIASGVTGPELDIEFEDDFGGNDDPPPAISGTWTLAVMSSLKTPGQKLSAGWVRRLLRTSLPLGKTISIFFNDELLTSAKSNIDVANEWILGPGLKLDSISLPSGEVVKIEERGAPYPHLLIDGIGEVSGRVRLYASPISGGKSDSIEVSNGFFINIRGRVLKPEDPYFGLENLSHSVWARFRATVRADGLDDSLSVNREAVQVGRPLQILRVFLMRLFNRARQDYDAKTAGSWPDVGSVLTEKWGIVPFEPLKRVVRESMSNASNLPDFVHIRPDAQVEEVVSNWDTATKSSMGEMITDVVVSDLGPQNKLAHYDLETRTVVVNKNHPFAVEHQETSQQLRVLRDTALVELLTDAFMVDIGITPDQMTEIRDYKDRAFRLVAQVRRRSASQIASLLLEATGHAKGFEQIIGDALEYIGFNVERMGQSGQPEGIATALISPGAEDIKAIYTFNYDAKSSEKSKVKTHNVGIAGLARHREDHKADYTLVVAPSYEEGALEDECKAAKVTPMNAADLARLVMMTVGYGPLNLIEFRAVFTKHTPADVSQWIDGVIAAQKAKQQLPLGILIQALTTLAEKNPHRPEMLNCSQIAEQCRELLQDQTFPSRTNVANAIRAIALMAPSAIALSNWDVILSASPGKITELLSAQINAIPDNYRYGIARAV